MDVPTSASADSSFRQNFERKLMAYENQCAGTKKRPWTQKRISDVMNHIKQGRMNLETGTRKTSMLYYWMSKYEIVNEDNEEYLIIKTKKAEDPTLRIIPREEYFDFLSKIHYGCRHGGRDKMLSIIKTQYYITKIAVETYISLCPNCENRKFGPRRKSLVVKDSPTPERQHSVLQYSYINIGELDILDLNDCPDGDYKWLLKYQDCTTMFFSLRPLKTNQINEVSLELMKIFMTFGAPYMIHSNNRIEFITEVIKELTVIWPACRITHSNVKSQKIQTAIKKNSNDVLNMLQSWMSEKNSTNWSTGCYFVQYLMNSSTNHAIGKSPYKALFGIEPKADSDSPASPPSALTCDNKPNQKSSVQECGENINSNMQQFSDNIVNRNNNGLQLSDNMLSLSQNSKIEIKIEIDEWDANDHDVMPDEECESSNNVDEKSHEIYIKEETILSEREDTDSEGIEDHRGIKREAETIEGNMPKKVPPFPGSDTLYVCLKQTKES